MTPRLTALTLAVLLPGLPTAARADADDGAKVYTKVLPSVVWIHSSRGGGHFIPLGGIWRRYGREHFDR